MSSSLSRALILHIHSAGTYFFEWRLDERAARRRFLFCASVLFVYLEV